MLIVDMLLQTLLPATGSAMVCVELLK